jgi:hypothetical protein
MALEIHVYSRLGQINKCGVFNRLMGSQQLFGRYNVYSIFIFHPILMQFLSLTWLHRELIWFRDKLDRNWTTKAICDHLYGLLKDHRKKLLFYFEKGTRRGPKTKISHIWKAYYCKTNDQNNIIDPNITVSSNLLWQAKYSVHTCF